MQALELIPENISAATNRFGFSALTLLVNELGLSTGVGRDGVAAAIIGQLEDENSQRRIQGLLTAYQEHIIFGDKLINLHPDMPENYLQRFRDQLHYLEIPQDNLIAQSWPNALNEKAIIQLIKDEPVLVHIESQTNCTHLIYSGVIAVNRQTEFRPEQLGENRPEFTNEFKHIIGITPIPRQIFDIITLHDDGKIEIKIDYYKGNNTHIGTNEKRQRIKKLRDNLDELARAIMPEPIPWNPPLNFYPHIEQLMKNKEVILGKVGQSDNQGCDASLSRRKRNEDVRDSTFFINGNAALAEKGDTPKSHQLLARFDLSRNKREHYPELTIHSRPDIHQEPLPAIHDAIITKNIGKSDYLTILDTLLSTD